MNKLNNSKKSISEKPKRADLVAISHDDIYSNPLKLTKELLKELDDKDLVPRFINAKDLYRNQGYHKAGWKPYKTQCVTMNESMKDFHEGGDPEGIIRRGDCILAAKSKEDVARHKAYLARKAAQYKDFDREQAKEMRALAKEHGGTVIHEGYDEN